MTALRERIARTDLGDLDRRELIDAEELEVFDALSARPRAGAAWDPARHRMRVSGDVAHWSGDLEVRVRQDGIALVEWEGTASLPHQMIEELSWTFGRPADGELGPPPLVTAFAAGDAAGAVVLIRGPAVWRSLRRAFSAEELEAAAAPDALVIEADRGWLSAPLLPRLSRTRRGLFFPTACRRVLAAPRVAAIFRAVGQVVSDPLLQLCVAVEPGRVLVLDALSWRVGRVLVLDALSWRVGRSAGSLHRVDFASPTLAGLGLGFKVP